MDESPKQFRDTRNMRASTNKNKNIIQHCGPNPFSSYIFSFKKISQREIHLTEWTTLFYEKRFL